MKKKKLTYEDPPKKVKKLKKQNQALEASKSSENKTIFETFFTDSYSIMLIIEYETGRIISANKSACKFYGYSFEEITKMNIKQINTLPPAQIKKEMQKAKMGKKNYFVFKHSLKSGEIKDVEIYSSQILIDNKPYLYVIIHDITEIKKAEREKRESHLLYQALFENNADGVLIIDPKTAGFIEFNEQACKQLGYTREEFAKLRIFDVEVFEKEEETKVHINKILEQGKDEFYTKQKTKQGEIRDVYIIAQVLEVGGEKIYHCIWRDITKYLKYQDELIKAKEKAEENEKKLQRNNDLLIQFIKHSPIHTFIKDVNDKESRVIYASENYVDMIGIPGSKMIGKNMHELFPKDFAEKITADDIKVVKKGIKLKLEEELNDKYYITYKVPIKQDNASFLAGFTIDISEQKRSEQEIIKAKEHVEESERKLSEAQKFAKFGNWELDIESGIFTFNDNFYALYHTTAEEMGGYQISMIDYATKFVHPDDSKMVETETKKAIATGDPNFTNYTEHRIIYNDGGIGYIAVRYRVVKDENGKTIKTVGVNQEITEKKIIENELIKAKERVEESERKFKELFEKSGDSFLILENEVFVDGNQAALKMFNLSNKEELLNIHPSELSPEFQPEGKDSREKANEMMKIALEKGTHRFEWTHKKKTGEEFPVEVLLTKIINTPQKRVIHSVCRDITDRKLIEKNLILAKEKAEENELKFKLAFYTSPDSININKLDGEYVEINEGFKRLTGYTEEDVIGKSSKEIGIWSIPKDREKLIDALQKFGYITNLESVFRVKDGRLIPALMSAKIIKISNEPHILSMTRDISERKKYEQELIAAKEKAEESDKLKTAFLHNMSHEIRTPLNAICGFTDLLNDSNLSEEKREHFISIIQNSSQQLLAIVSDIITISSLETKQEKINIDKVCINNIILDLLTIFKKNAENNNISIYAKQTLSDKETEIYTDRTKIIQILSNLLSNALKFTHKGFVEFGYILKNTELEFYVKDTGIGIKKEVQEKIFNRFQQGDYTIHKKYGGTGLGLAISKGFVELLGGKIWLESEPDKGSTFYFTIPYKLAEEIKEEKSKIIAKKKIKKPKILVAEDEEINFLFIEQILSDLNVDLINAKDGQETIDLFRTNPDISLILMDIKMPIITGDEAAKIIKEQNPDIPIIAQSAYALEDEIKKYKIIFDEYLTKPIKKDLLKEVVKKYLDKF